jgi:Right handed beta helix region
MLRATIAIAAGLAFAAGIPIAPAQAAGAARTFLSAAGSDSNNCTNVATPCRHLAAAFAATATDGEIYVLDPANYGSLTITHGVSIEGHGWASIAPVTGQAAITINAPSGDRINIIGVVLDGTAVAGTTGIQFNSGGSLTVRDSVVRNFSNYGIDFVPNNLTLSQLFVSNTLVSDNITGIFIEPTGSVSQTMNGVLNHVEIENNASDGLRVSPVALTTNLTVSDSVSANNAADGIHTFSNGGALVSVMVRNSTIANNGANGLDGGTGSTIRVTRSTITGNATGWAGVVLSYADNNIDGNGAANTEPPSPLAYK